MSNRFYTPSELDSLRLAENKIFGKAGAGSLSSSTQNVNNHKGNFGEAIIGNILNLITIETPEAYVCHSVGLPDGRQGETDHVLIYRNRVILVETKAFSGYTSYSVNKEGYLKASKQGQRKTKVNDSNAYAKVALYQQYFTNRKVQCVLAITRDQIKTYSENEIYKICSLDNIMSVIRAEMEEAETVNEPAWPAVKFFASLCIAEPRKVFPEVITGSTPVISLDDVRVKNAVRSNEKYHNKVFSR